MHSLICSLETTDNYTLCVIHDACRGLDGRMKFGTFLYNKHFQAYQKKAFTLV